MDATSDVFCLIAAAAEADTVARAIAQVAAKAAEKAEDDARYEADVAAELAADLASEEAESVDGTDADGGSESSSGYSSDYYQPDSDNCDTNCSVEYSFQCDVVEYERGERSKPVRPRKLKNRRKHRWAAEAQENKNKTKRQDHNIWEH